MRKDAYEKMQKKLLDAQNKVEEAESRAAKANKKLNN